ncbi:MAG TPA: hypothetical protein VFF73_36665 [Planctomycetota bacterium]|nr:hypothetical protein [Planctomycetota bacterium]
MTDCEKFVDALAGRDVAAQKALAAHVASCAACRETAENMASFHAEFDNERKITINTGNLREKVIAGAQAAVAEAAPPRGEVVKLSAPSRQWKTFLMAASVGIVMFGVGALGPWGKPTVETSPFLKPFDEHSIASTDIDYLAEKIKAARALYKLGYVKVAKEIAEDVKTRTKVPAIVLDAQDIIDDKLPR